MDPWTPASADKAAAATSSYRTGQSGVAAAKQERIKEGKYSAAAAAVNIHFIPFAMETYGKLGTKALRLLRTLGQDLADSNQPSALRPWHARSFMDSALQRLATKRGYVGDSRPPGPGMAAGSTPSTIGVP